ncbi:hypothetical protein NOS3756_09750 [Nostoc sp. NIES-3756]|uniref:hypothetical protein n=1 Tax=Nostoc sp. NIES-3756 TaxID=1751286 RepID=UPI00072194CF|nr:hypothetical protein [Nostoc sp. NIES-3756]BAT52044.1 hypothetical protein NOS3756_09750 [Nostoc sp. NIES-3756]BAY40253.1 hypothetical protein NIES2111_46360 [Nostoc sp. NIES-2111]
MLARCRFFLENTTPSHETGNKTTNAFVSNIRVRSLTFALNDNLDVAGKSFLNQLLHSV